MNAMVPIPAKMGAPRDARAQRFRANRTLRNARRAVARRVLTERCSGLLHFFRINDRIGSHVTLWLTPEVRAEWWPGCARLRLPDGRDVLAEPAHLLDVLRALQAESGGER